MRRTLAALLTAGVFLLWPSASQADDAKPAPTEPAAGAADAPVKHLLRYKFRVGDELRWKVVHRSAMRASVQGETKSTESVTSSVKVWRVTKVEPDGTATFSHHVEDVDMWQKVPGRSKITYNSATDAKPPAGFEQVAKSVGVVLSVITLNDRGNILGRVQKADSAVASRGEITLPLPEHEVAVGESWSIPQTLEVPLEEGTVRKIRVLQRFTLRSVHTGVARIGIENLILTPVHDPAIQAKLIQREPHGEVRFDVENGRVLSQQMDIDKRVIGFQGESSSMSYMARITEDFLPPESKVAAR